MLKGFWKLSWVEIKIFLREPMGVVGTLGLPVLLFVVLGRSLRTVRPGADTIAQAPFNVAILAALMIAVNAVLSLVAVISIYREGGILKRLRATPLSPLTILSAPLSEVRGWNLAAPIGRPLCMKGMDQGEWQSLLNVLPTVKIGQPQRSVWRLLAMAAAWETQVRSLIYLAAKVWLLPIRAMA